jgi:Na+/H+-dicarboxylate symporter
MRIAVHWQIVAAVGLGGLAGYVSRSGVFALGVDSLSLYELLGTLFVNGLKMVAAPLVVTSVIACVSGLGSGRELGRLGCRTLFFYLFTTLAAVLVAVAIFGILKPGLIDGLPAGARLSLHARSAEISSRLTTGAGGVTATLLSIVPPNLFAAALDGNLLGLVFFSLMIGYSLSRIASEHARLVRGCVAVLSEALIHTTATIMRFAPVGVFALVAHTVAKSGFDSEGPLLLFCATVVAGLLLYALALLPALVWLVARGSPWLLVSAMSPALLMGFSTASSSATLATSIDCLERRVGVSNRVAGFVMSLGASLNHAGTALYECVAVLFIAQAYGLTLSFGQKVTVAFMALGTSMGMAGIPAASLVAITAILTTLGLPAEVLGVLLVFDRILDMCRTAVNVFADACCAVIVARLESQARGGHAISSLPDKF